MGSRGPDGLPDVGGGKGFFVGRPLPGTNGIDAIVDAFSRNQESQVRLATAFDKQNLKNAKVDILMKVDSAVTRGRLSFSTSLSSLLPQDSGGDAALLEKRRRSGFLR